MEKLIILLVCSPEASFKERLGYNNSNNNVSRKAQKAKRNKTKQIVSIIHSVWPTSTTLRAPAAWQRDRNVDVIADIEFALTQRLVIVDAAIAALSRADIA